MIPRLELGYTAHPFRTASPDCLVIIENFCNMGVGAIQGTTSLLEAQQNLGSCGRDSRPDVCGAMYVFCPCASATGDHRVWIDSAGAGDFHLLHAGLSSSLCRQNEEAALANQNPMAGDWRCSALGSVVGFQRRGIPGIAGGYYLARRRQLDGAKVTAQRLFVLLLDNGFYLAIKPVAGRAVEPIPGCGIACLCGLPLRCNN